MPWVSRILPGLAGQLSRDSVRKDREDEKLALFTAGKITAEEYLLKSDDEDVMLIDNPILPSSAPPPAKLSQDVEILDTSSGSTAVDAKVKNVKKPVVKVEGKGKDKTEVRGKGTEKVVNRPNRDPPNLPKDASLVSLSVDLEDIPAHRFRRSIPGALAARMNLLLLSTVTPLRASPNASSATSINRNVRCPRSSQLRYPFSLLNVARSLLMVHRLPQAPASLLFSRSTASRVFDRAKVRASRLVFRVFSNR